MGRNESIDDHALEQLFLRYRDRGDIAALATVYDRTSIELLSVATHLCERVADAENTVEMTYLLALDVRDQWDADRPLVPWLIGLVVRAVRHRRVAAGIAAAAVPARGLDAVRDVVLSRAAELASEAAAAAASAVPPQVTQPVVEAATTGAPATAPRVPARTLLAATTAVLVTAALVLWSESDPPQRAEPRVAIAPAIDAFVDVAPELFDQAPPLPHRAVVQTIEGERAGACTVEFELRSAGAPAVGASVRLECLGSSPASWVTTIQDRWGQRTIVEPIQANGARPRFDAATTADGTCRFAGLEPAFWLVHLPGSSGVVELIADREVRVSIDLDEFAVPVRGRVTDEFGRGLADVSITTSSDPFAPADAELGRSDTEGRFAVFGAPGAVVLASTSGRRARGFRVPPGRVDGIDLVLPSGGVDVHGFVRDAVTRAPIAGAVVQVGDVFDVRETRSPGGGPRSVRGVVRSVRTDDAGAFVVRGLDPGEVGVRARAPGFGARDTSVRIAPATDRPLELSLPGAAMAAGVVRDASGAPMPGIKVAAAWGESALDRDITSTDAGGRYRFVGLRPGSVRLTAGTGERGHAVAVVDVTAEAVAEWSPVLTPDDMTIRGRVRVEPGATVVRPLVVVRDDSTRREIATVDPADGRFAFTLLPFELRRVSTLLVYDAHGTDEDARPLAIAVARASGVSVDSGDVDLVVRASAPADRGVVFGSIEVESPGRLRGASLLSETPGDRIVLAAGRRPVGASTPFRAVDVVPGRYGFAVNGRVVRRIEVAPGQRLDLGVVRVPARAAVPVDAQRVAVAFLPPRTQTRFGRLRVEIWAGAVGDGEPVSRHRVSWRSGAWRLPLSLSPAVYTVTARDLTGLHVETPLEITGAADQTSYAIRVPLSRD